MLYYVILCYKVLYYVILCCTILNYVMLTLTMLYYVYTMLYDVIRCYTMVYYVILCNASIIYAGATCMPFTYMYNIYIYIIHIHDHVDELSWFTKLLPDSGSPPGHQSVESVGRAQEWAESLAVRRGQWWKVTEGDGKITMFF